jgi:hypothetical protein
MLCHCWHAVAIPYRLHVFRCDTRMVAKEWRKVCQPPLPVTFAPPCRFCMAQGIGLEFKKSIAPPLALELTIVWPTQTLLLT